MRLDCQMICEIKRHHCKFQNVSSIPISTKFSTAQSSLGGFSDDSSEYIRRIFSLSNSDLKPPRISGDEWIDRWNLLYEKPARRCKAHRTSNIVCKFADFNFLSASNDFSIRFENATSKITPLCLKNWQRWVLLSLRNNFPTGTVGLSAHRHAIVQTTDMSELNFEHKQITLDVDEPLSIEKLGTLLYCRSRDSFRKLMENVGFIFAIQSSHFKCTQHSERFRCKNIMNSFIIQAPIRTLG